MMAAIDPPRSSKPQGTIVDITDSQVAPPERDNEPDWSTQQRQDPEVEREYQQELASIQEPAEGALDLDKLVDTLLDQLEADFVIHKRPRQNHVWVKAMLSKRFEPLIRELRDVREMRDDHYITVLSLNEALSESARDLREAREYVSQIHAIVAKHGGFDQGVEVPAVEWLDQSLTLIQDVQQLRKKIRELIDDD